MNRCVLILGIMLLFPGCAGTDTTKRDTQDTFDGKGAQMAVSGPEP